MGNSTHRTFRGWLSHHLDEQGIARRELARRLATKHPAGATPQTIETYRRALYRYLDESDPMLPNEQTRAAFADALGVGRDEVPVDEEEEPEDLSATLQALARDSKELSRTLNRVLRAVKA